MGYDVAKALKRTVEFTNHPEQKGMLVRCETFGSVKRVKAPALEECVFPKDIVKLMDFQIENHMYWREAHEALDDDYIPALKPYLGIAEHSCFLGGEVRYGGNTSYQEPAIDDVADFRRLRFDETRPHFHLLMEGMACLKEKSREYGFFTALRGFDGPLDIANAIRGNDLLYDFYDDPENTKAFVDFCADGCAWSSEKQRRFADVVEGGYISGFGIWMPGNSIGHLSEDATTLCSPKIYEEFGLPYMQKLLNAFDFAFLHVHSLGRNMIPLFRRMDKIKMYQLSDDPNQPSAMDVYKQYAKELEGTIVNLDLTPEAVKANLAFLKERRTIVNLQAKSIDEAKEIIALAREQN